VKVQIKGLEEVQEKYQKMMKKEKEKKEKIKEIKKMQLDAAKKEIEKIEEKAKEEEKKIKIASLVNSLKKEKESFKHVDGTYWIGKTEVYEDNNWDLKENLQGNDYEFYDYKNQKGIRPNRDSKGKIPVNIGCGIKACESNEMLFTDFKNDDEDKIVTLNISSWIGMSPGAIHYYGCLKFSLPWLHQVKNPNMSQSNFDLKLLKYGNIKLTHKLKAWELKKYPNTYDSYRVGNSYRGFYTQEELIKRGKEVFKDLFGEGWKLKIEKY
jgi:hypothetical protein